MDGELKQRINKVLGKSCKRLRHNIKWSVRRLEDEIAMRFPNDPVSKGTIENFEKGTTDIRISNVVRIFATLLDISDDNLDEFLRDLFE